MAISQQQSIKKLDELRQAINKSIAPGGIRSRTTARADELEQELVDLHEDNEHNLLGPAERRKRIAEIHDEIESYKRANTGDYPGFYEYMMKLLQTSTQPRNVLKNIALIGIALIATAAIAYAFPWIVGGLAAALIVTGLLYIGAKVLSACCKCLASSLSNWWNGTSARESRRADAASRAGLDKPHNMAPMGATSGGQGIVIHNNLGSGQAAAPNVPPPYRTFKK